jgi:hypothetical protein
MPSMMLAPKATRPWLIGGVLRLSDRFWPLQTLIFAGEHFF